MGSKRLVAVIAAAVAFGAGAQAAEASPAVGCVVGPAEYKQGSWHVKDINPRVRPRRCGYVDDYADQGRARYLHQLRWRRWDERKAVGRGRLEGDRARITLYRPKGLGFDDPSTLAYTRMVVKVPGVSRRTYELPWGYDLWPLY
jgi:opacity protein-like surface antigen